MLKIPEDQKATKPILVTKIQHKQIWKLAKKRNQKITELIDSWLGYDELKEELNAS